jgi:hypothetical protein
MGGAGRALGGGRIRAVLAEFARARAAEQRYRYLRLAGAAALPRDGIAPADIPRRIFEEFYSSSAEPRSGVPWKSENLGDARRSASPSTNPTTRSAAVAWRYAAHWQTT